jgi:hypothetical protein
MLFLSRGKLDRIVSIFFFLSLFLRAVRSGLCSLLTKITCALEEAKDWAGKIGADGRDADGETRERRVIRGEG